MTSDSFQAGRSGGSVQGRESELAAIIRPARVSDRSALESLFCQLQDYERTIEPNRADAESICRAYIDRLEQLCAAQAGAIIVAEVDGQIAGFVCVLGRVDSNEMIEADREFAYVSDLYVAPDQRGGGIGEKLMGAAEDHARSCGARRLRVGVLAANPGAYRFYRKRGFRESELVLEKQIAGDQGAGSSSGAGNS